MENPTGKPYGRIAIIGAGPSGLTAIKSMLEWGLEPVAFEKAREIGGLWKFDESQPDGGGVAYRSLHTNTSKWMGVFSDFPFPEDAPAFPSRARMLQYLHDYADHFNLRPCIRLETAVERVRPAPDGRWEVTVRPKGGEPESRLFDAVVVASGFYPEPHQPELPGQARFQGEVLHSMAYKGPERFAGRQVIVLGCGSSGADIAADLGPVAAQVDVSVRQGLWFLPKMIQDQAYDLRRSRFSQKIPAFLANRVFNRLLLDSYREIGFDDETLPLLNLPAFDIRTGKFIPATDILHEILAGRVRMRPEIAHVAADHVVFVDGSQAAADVLLFATGYNLALPFLDETVMEIEDRYTIRLYLQVFHPELDNLAFLAMNFAGGAAFPLMEIQARWIARVFSGDLPLPPPAERKAWIEAYFGKHEAAGTDPMSLSLPVYLNELGDVLGVNPQPWKHPTLAPRLVFGPQVPAQLRLDGPGRSERAADWIASASEA